MAQQTLLQLVQNKAQKLGLPYPSAVIGSTDAWVLQMLQCLQDEVQEHANREFNFPTLKRSATFTGSPDLSSYILVTFDSATFGTGAYRSMVSDTFWDRTLRLKVVGPITDQDWAAMLAMSSAPSYPVFRVLGDGIQVYPTTSSDHTYACDYMSKFGVQATGGGTLKEFFTVDTDVTLMPSRIVSAGLEWRWKSMKGLPYAEDFRRYESFLVEEAAREAIPTILDMSNCQENAMAYPGLLIAAGSWNL